jgi:prephenate dehydrogenase
MAGRERSGPVAARADLFLGRPWVLCPGPESEPERVDQVRRLTAALGATPITMPADEHDDAVALVSHVPQVAASLVAARLTRASDGAVSLAGQGVRDVTRIAAGDPALWQQIIGANTGALTALLTDVRADVETLLAALADGDRAPIGALLERGVRGTAGIPGKHGAPTGPVATLYVVIPDHPGELARLFADASEIGVNIEDVRIDHDPGREYGLLELSVAADSVEHLLASLEDRGWTTHR